MIIKIARGSKEGDEGKGIEEGKEEEEVDVADRGFVCCFQQKKGGIFVYIW